MFMFNLWVLFTALDVVHLVITPPIRILNRNMGWIGGVQLGLCQIKSDSE